MKMTKTLLLTILAALYALLLCAGTVSAARYEGADVADGLIVQPEDEVCFPENAASVKFHAVWNETPVEPTPTPRPVEPTPTPRPNQNWYVINPEDMPKTGYGPDSRPLLYGLGALALAAMGLARRKRSADK